MRVGLNLLHAVPDIGGGWNYIENIVAVLARQSVNISYVAFANAVSATLVPDVAHFRVEIMPIRPGHRGQRILFEHSVLQALAWRHRIDCMHWFANGQGIINACPAVVTVYDMQPFLRYAQLSRVKRRLLQWSLRTTAKRAARLVPMSQTTADALHTILGADPDRMTVVPPVLEDAFHPPRPEDVRGFRERHRLPGVFWLYVAHVYPHKNHARLLEAYRRLKSGTAPVWPLVLRGDHRGQPLDLQPLVRQLGLDDDVIVLPRLAREELPMLYGAATALVFPSLYEGAGMPVLEAQACGCPVAASDIPAVREFAGDAAAYFDPTSIEGIAEAMSQLAAAPSVREQLRAKGLARAVAFRAIKVVDRLQDAYQRASRLSH